MKFETKIINNKEIFICEKHNEVLHFWRKYKNDKPYILSFDHHTDTKIAFQNKFKNDRLSTNDELIERLKNNEFTLIDELKNDEHIDAAIRCDFIEKALLLTVCNSKSSIEYLLDISNFEKYDDNTRILVNTTLFYTDVSIDTKILEKEIERFKLCINQDEWINNFILDIDLDFFHYKKSISVVDLSFFNYLVKKSKAITIARERTFIETWKREYDKDLSVEFLENELIKIIEKALNTTFCIGNS